MPEDGGPVGDGAISSYSGCCSLCHQHKSKRGLLKCGCTSHAGYACYSCLRNYYIVGPKTVYNFSFRCNHPGCGRALPNKLVQSFYAKGERLGFDSGTEYQRYCKLARLARHNQKLLGSNWESILKNLLTMARIMGISFRNGAGVPRTPHDAWYRRNSCDDGFAKCKHCKTIVLKDGGCNHMTCPACGKDYSFRDSKIPIHEMDVGTVYLVSMRNGKGRHRPKLRLSPVMEDFETEWGNDEEDETEEDQLNDMFGKELSFSAGGDEAFGSEDDEASVSETSHISLWVDDLISGIYDDISIVSAGEETKQSWSVVSSPIQPTESLASFSVVSGVGSVCSLDEFDDLASCASSGAVGLFSPPTPPPRCDVVTKPTPAGAMSYCDVVKKSVRAEVTHEIPHEAGTAVGSAGCPTPAKEQPPSEEYYDDGGIFVCDDAKYDGRGGKMALRYSGGSSRSGDQHEPCQRGSRLTRKQRKTRRVLRCGGGKGDPGQRYGFRTTKSAARRYFGI